jgi:hypothetical protein
MGTPLNQRPNNIFLSHSSRDKLDFVDGLYHWLTKKAGLKVWYDRNLVSGEVASNLEIAIDSSQAAIIVLSENAVESPWVKTECGRLQEEAARNGGDFRIATVRLDSVDPPGLLKSFKHIDIAEGALSANTASLLMDSLFGGKDSATGKSVYLSRGWRTSERPAAERLCQALQMSGLRLVCDWTDQPHYDTDRVRNIMEGTGGLVAIVPHRGNGETSKYIIAEIATARDAGMPILPFIHRDVTVRPEWSLPEPLVFDDAVGKQKAGELAELFGNRIEDFAQSWRKAKRGEHIFLGHSLEENIDDNFLTARGMLSRITGLPVEVGGLVGGFEAQSEIVRLVQEAGLCIIDITNLTYENLPAKIDFALNSCIEAGIALGCNKPLYLTCRGPRRSPPFMLRNKQVWFYEDDLDLIGKLRQIAALHRRMVL